MQGALQRSEVGTCVIFCYQVGLLVCAYCILDFVSVQDVPLAPYENSYSSTPEHGDSSPIMSYIIAVQYIVEHILVEMVPGTYSTCTAPELLRCASATGILVYPVPRCNSTSTRSMEYGVLLPGTVVLSILQVAVVLGVNCNTLAYSLYNTTFVQVLKLRT